MAPRIDLLREGVKRPLVLAYHPLYRFYEGGSMTRDFRGLPAGKDDWWSEDWVGSCTRANNDDPNGGPQGLSTVEIPGVGGVELRELVEALPVEMVGSAFAERWGPGTGVLVKLLSPAGQVPLHAHPTREWAKRHLGSPFGKTEAWILLDTPGDGTEAAYAGVGFRPDISREWFADAVRRHDNQSVRGTLHRTDVHPGEVFVAHAGVPHYLGPRISFIEIQEPSDHIVIAETSGDDDDGATMGLGWDLALDMIDYSGAERAQTLARARQVATPVRTSHGSTEARLFDDDVSPFFDAARLDVVDEIDVNDERFSILVAMSGAGSIEGDFGSLAIRRGETLGMPASLGFAVRAGAEPLQIVRCFGPRVE